MSENVRAKAEATLAEVQKVTAAVLPEPNAVTVSLDQADQPTSDEISRRMAEIDITDTNSIVRFGSRAQAELQQISQAMLSGVKNQEVGPAGNSLREIVATSRGFSVSELDPNRKPSFWERLMGKAKPMAKFVAKYEEVRAESPVWPEWEFPRYEGQRIEWPDYKALRKPPVYED